MCVEGASMMVWRMYWVWCGSLRISQQQQTHPASQDTLPSLAPPPIRRQHCNWWRPSWLKRFTLPSISTATCLLNKCPTPYQEVVVDSYTNLRERYRCTPGLSNGTALNSMYVCTSAMCSNVYVPQIECKHNQNVLRHAHVLIIN